MSNICIIFIAAQVPTIHSMDLCYTAVKNATNIINNGQSYTLYYSIEQDKIQWREIELSYNYDIERRDARVFTDTYKHARTHTALFPSEKLFLYMVVFMHARIRMVVWLFLRVALVGIINPNTNTIKRRAQYAVLQWHIAVLFCLILAHCECHMIARTKQTFRL